MPEEIPTQECDREIPIPSGTPECGSGECPPCSDSLPSSDELQLQAKGYSCLEFENCAANTGSPCIEGNCLDCYLSDVKFLGGFVSGFNSKIGLGASEGTVSVDLIYLKEGRDFNRSCDTDNQDVVCTGTAETYNGSLGNIYTFNVGGFCFRGILTNHTYSEGNDGFKYRLTLSDGRNILENIKLVLNGAYQSLPSEFYNNSINVLYELESSVGDDTCGNGKKCKDFMISGADKRGIKLKKALEAINNKTIQIPISELCLTLDVSKVINIVSEEFRTSNQESSVLDLINLACEESGYSFLTKITNDNELSVIPINYKDPAQNNPLYSFISDLINQNIVTSHEYGEEISYENDKRVIYGDYVHYITEVYDPEFYKNCKDVSPTGNCNIIYGPGDQPDVRIATPDKNEESYKLLISEN